LLRCRRSRTRRCGGDPLPPVVSSELTISDLIALGERMAGAVAGGSAGAQAYEQTRKFKKSPGERNGEQNRRSARHSAEKPSRAHAADQVPTGPRGVTSLDMAPTRRTRVGRAAPASRSNSISTSRRAASTPILEGDSHGLMRWAKFVERFASVRGIDDLLEDCSRLGRRLR
jgi:hypothetical protein